MALASASSYTQFSAVCTSGNGKKGTNLVFQGPKLFRNFRLPVSSWKKTCQNIPTVLKYSRKSTPHLPFYHIFPPEFEISQFLGWIKSPRLRLGDFIQPKNCEISNSGGNIFCETHLPTHIWEVGPTVAPGIARFHFWWQGVKTTPMMLTTVTKDDNIFFRPVSKRYLVYTFICSSNNQARKFNQIHLSHGLEAG